MRITKKALSRRWLKASLGALVAGTLVGWLELSLRAQAGYSTVALQFRDNAMGYYAVFFTWAQKGVPMQRVLINWAADYIFIVLYAAAFFYSGIIVREALATRPGRLRAVLTRIAAIPIAGAVLDAVENLLEGWQFVSGNPSDALVHLAFTISLAKYAAFFVGLALLLAALWVQVLERQKQRLRSLSEGP